MDLISQSNGNHSEGNQLASEQDYHEDEIIEAFLKQNKVLLVKKNSIEESFMSSIKAYELEKDH